MDMLIASVMLANVIIFGIIVTLLIKFRKKEGVSQEANFRAFCIMGIIMAPSGILLIAVYYMLQIALIVGFPLFGVGLVYLIVGLVNRNKWKKNKGWNQPA